MSQSAEISNAKVTIDKKTVAHFASNPEGDIRVEFRSRMANTLLSTLVIPASKTTEFAKQFTVAPKSVWTETGIVRD